MFGVSWFRDKNNSDAIYCVPNNLVQEFLARDSDANDMDLVEMKKPNPYQWCVAYFVTRHGMIRVGEYN